MANTINVPYVFGAMNGLGASNQAMIDGARYDIARGDVYTLRFYWPYWKSAERLQVGSHIKVNHVTFDIVQVWGDLEQTFVSVRVGDASPFIYLVYGVGTLLGVGAALYLGGEAAEKVGEAVEKSETAVVTIGGVVVLGAIFWLLFIRKRTA